MGDLILPPGSEWKAILSSKKPENWVVYQVKKKGRKKRRLALVKTGPGGLKDALEVIQDDAVHFFGFRVTGIDEKGGATSLRSKFVKVCYIGSGVSTMEKARTSGVSGTAFDFFSSCHVQFTTDDLAELSEDSIEKKLRASGGAHQVQRYDFTNGAARGPKIVKKKSKVGKVDYVAPDAAYESRGDKEEPTKEEAAASAKAERAARENAGAADKLEDSNIAGYGGAAHEALKLKAAEAEVNWVGAGSKPGIEIWRVENKKGGKFGVAKWPVDQYGTFYDGDSFIVLHTYKAAACGAAAAATEAAAAATSAAASDDAAPASEALQYDLYFWIGKDSTQDERGVAALKTVELDVFLGDKPVQCRVVEGSEPDRFVQLFNTGGKGMIVLNGGIDGGFNIVKPEEYEPRLLKVKGKMNAMSVQQVEFKASSLNKGDVFVLDGGLQLFQWNGPEANPAEKRRAQQVVLEIYANRQRGDGIVKTPIVMDDNDDDDFWKLLGGSPDDIQAAAADDAAVEKFEPHLYRVSDAAGKMEYERVAVGTLNKSMLGSGDVYILDAATEIYVWIGSGASKQERRCAMFFAQDCLASNGEHENSPITRLHEKDPVLPSGFRNCFSDLTNE